MKENIIIKFLDIRRGIFVDNREEILNFIADRVNNSVAFSFPDKRTERIFRHNKLIKSTFNFNPSNLSKKDLNTLNTFSRNLDYSAQKKFIQNIFHKEIITPLSELVSIIIRRDVDMDKLMNSLEVEKLTKEMFDSFCTRVLAAIKINLDSNKGFFEVIY